MSNRVDDVAYEQEGFEEGTPDARSDYARAEIARKPVGKAEEMIALINDRVRSSPPRR